MYTPLAVANAIVSRHPGRSTMGVCKLVYLVQGWSLAHGHPIVGALPEVWRYALVHRDVYEAYHVFGRVPPHAPQAIPNGVSVPMVPDADERAISIIDQIVARYAHVDDLDLSEIAHAKGSPWRIVAERHGFKIPNGTVVDEALMLSHFTRLLNESRRVAA